MERYMNYIWISYELRMITSYELCMYTAQKKFKNTREQGRQDDDFPALEIYDILIWFTQ